MARAAEVDGQHRQHTDLRREGLGARHADLGTRVKVDTAVMDCAAMLPAPSRFTIVLFTFVIAWQVVQVIPA